MRISLSLLGVDVQVQVEDPLLAEAVDLLWAPFRNEDAAGHEVVIRRGRQSWRIESDSQPKRSADTRWGTVLLLRGVLDALAMVHRSDLCGLHAAVVVKDEVGLALPGPPGSGKTTLAVSLLNRGWTLACDDLAPLTQGGDVLPFPRPVGLRRESLAGEAFPHLACLLSLLGQPVGPFLVPATPFRLDHDRLKLSHVMFPTFQPAADLSVETLSGAEVLASAARSLQPLDGRTLGVARAVFDGVVGARMSFGETADVAALVDKWVAAVEVGVEVAENEVNDS